MNIRCYKCGSKNVSVSLSNESKYSVGKGAVGTLLFGTGGAAMGVNGKNSESKRFICQACGEVATFSMNADTCAGIEKALRENDESALEIKKRFYPNIEWEEPSDVVKPEVELKTQKVDSRFEYGSLVELLNLDCEIEDRDKLSRVQDDALLQHLCWKLQKGVRYTSGEISEILPCEWNNSRVIATLRRLEIAHRVLHVFEGGVSYYVFNDVYRNEADEKLRDVLKAEQFARNDEDKEICIEKADSVLTSYLERKVGARPQSIYEIMEIIPVEWTKSSTVEHLERLERSGAIIKISKDNIEHYFSTAWYYDDLCNDYTRAQKIEEFENVKRGLVLVKNSGYCADDEEFSEELNKNISNCDKEIEKILDEQRKKKEEQRRKKYNKACAEFKASETLQDFQRVSEIFRKFGDYENSKDNYKKCIEQINIIQERINSIQQRKANNLCQHCGGDFKGIFSKKCKVCGKGKDY